MIKQGFSLEDIITKKKAMEEIEIVGFLSQGDITQNNYQDFEEIRVQENEIKSRDKTANNDKKIEKKLTADML